MDRWAFISTLALGFLAAPLAGEAQHPRLPRIGILTTASSASSPSREL